MMALDPAMSQLGQSGLKADVRVESDLAPIADVARAPRHVAEVPIVLQKSPSGLCEIEICNYRLGAPVLLNRCCAFQPDLESIFLAEMLKILLQHYLPLPDSGTEAFGVLKFRPMHAVKRECSPFSVSSG